MACAIRAYDHDDAREYECRTPSGANDWPYRREHADCGAAEGDAGNIDASTPSGMLNDAAA